MTAAKISPDDRAGQAESSEKTSILSPVQIAAGALAAVSAAVVASLFGLAGTLIGAALASVVSTVSAALYGESLRRTNERLQLARSRVTVPAGEPDATRVLPKQLDPRRAPVRWRPRWPRIAAGAVAVFALAMGIVTGVELIGRQPVSALVGSSSSSGTTTIGALSNAASHRDETPSTPASPTTPAPATSSDESTPESTPTGAPSETATDGVDRADPSETETSESAPSSSTRSSAEPTDPADESAEQLPGLGEDQPTVP